MSASSSTRPDRARVRRLFPRFVEQANPFIRRIVLRAREYLETTLDPKTGETFLKPVQVRLHGDRDEDAIVLPPFLEDAYHLAEAFCGLLAERARSGFFRTLLLRWVGSTVEAGRRTVEKPLAEWTTLDEDEEDNGSLGQLRTLTPAERALLPIDAIPKQHPFQLRYQGVEKVNWEGCAEVLSAEERKRFLTRGWGE